MATKLTEEFRRASCISQTILLQHKYIYKYSRNITLSTAILSSSRNSFSESEADLHFKFHIIPVLSYDLQTLSD
jgi:hypothetical protein